VNPHNPLQRPGAYAVAARFAIDDPWTLSDRHPHRDSLAVLGQMVAEAAGELDELHGELTHLAQTAIKLLTSVGRGEHPETPGSHGVLRTIGPQIELLAALRRAAHRQLTGAMTSYQRLTPEPAAPPTPTTLDQNLGLATEPEPVREAGSALSDRELAALRRVEQGGLHLCQSALSEHDRHVSGRTDTGAWIWPETIDRLLQAGLLDKDTSTSRYRPGHLLSLTPAGEAALRAATGNQPAGDHVDATASAIPEGHQQASPASMPHAIATLPTAAQFKALQEIKHGTAVLKERSGMGSLYVVTGSDVRIPAVTVQAMQTKRWITRDTSTSLLHGQCLSLTAQGEAALQAAQAAAPRVSAALRRSTPTTTPARQAPAPAAGPATKPSRSR
jgi:DNA-binding MarR family transcriptional regulator